jgi:hypothetical protein
MEAVYVGCLPVEVEGHEQEEVSQQLQTQFNCYPVFLGAELKNNYYKSKKNLIISKIIIINSFPLFKTYFPVIKSFNQPFASPLFFYYQSSASNSSGP